AAVSEGVGLCLKLFLDTLARNGIEQVDPLGEPFDPARSEALAMVENPDAEPNSVIEVMQKGYVLNGRLVRAAKVIVAKAPAAGPAG
ncbi:MAG: nucleotide exchange factor GrpE, partial [Gammaproteobacteria bacterium]|nr:nucleotide exchange factor GrpE [Gammaproteobacteria bacterium]